MLKIHHIEARRSERVAWLMEELGLDYELVFTSKDILASLMNIRAVHPLGVAPMLEDGDLLLLESGAILEYIVNRHGGGRFGVPPSSPDYAAYLQWLHFAEGSAMARILAEMTLNQLLPSAPPGAFPLAEIYLGGARRLADYWEQWLAQRAHFAGDEFTAADIMMHMPVRFALSANADAEFPNCAAWRARVEARPAYVRMVARTLPNGVPPTLQGWPKEEADAPA